MRSMLSSWQHNPEGVPTAIRQEDDGSLDLSNVDIWMWLKLITPSKGMMIRQWVMQLFGEAGQWASLVDASKLLFKSFLLGSQDLKVNLCGLQQDIHSDGVK